jgi:hypothetical protein
LCRQRAPFDSLGLVQPLKHHLSPECYGASGIRPDVTRFTRTRASGLDEIDSDTVPQQALFAFWRWRSWPILTEGFLCLFSSDILRFLILAQTHKLAVPKVAVRRPFDELELPHELRLEPPTVHHLRGGKTRAPAPGLFLGQIREGALLDFQRFDLLEQFRSRCGREATAGPGGIDQPVALEVADDQRVEVL